MSLLQRYENARFFNDDEAWLLFRLAAFAEAIGWTVLIIGIILKRTVFHGNDAPVAIAGRIHGTLFILYFVAVIVLYPSLRWGKLQAALGLLAGIPPYGSLIFEKICSFQRAYEIVKRLKAQAFRLCIKI